MKQHYLSLFLFFSIITLLNNAMAAPANPNEAMIKDSYYQWCESIGKAHGDAQQVVQFYAANALLLPTLSGKVLTNKDGGLDAYFKKLTLLPDIKCTPTKLITRMYQKTAINTGLYTFSYTQNGKVINLPARFTFVYEKENGKWLIIKHHSSKSPE